MEEEEEEEEEESPQICDAGGGEGVTTPSATGLPAKRGLNDDREPVSLELPC